jgi:hypothetical protein
VYQLDHTRTSQRKIPRRFLPPLLPLGLVMVLAIAVLSPAHAVFPIFPLLIVFLLLAGWRFRLAGGGRLVPCAEKTSGDRTAVRAAGVAKEKELLEALGRHPEITAARVALETTLGVGEAEEMLSGLAGAGHLRVGAREGKLVYALWD